MASTAPQLNGVPTQAPIEELEIYRGLVKNCVHQLGILKQHDANFIFLETQWIMHLQQIDATIALRKAN